MNQSSPGGLLRHGPDTLTMNAASLLHAEAVRRYAEGKVEEADTLFARLSRILDQALGR